MKNGGKLIIVDIGNNFKEYRKTLEEQKLIHIKLTAAGFNGWWTGPRMSTSIIQAEKDKSIN
ncbi:Methyltransferase family protein (fragment) [Oenococcus oeni]